jgi:hypothetical protein
MMLHLLIESNAIALIEFIGISRRASGYGLDGTSVRDELAAVED